jgi:regulator of nonsense transcripts 2
MKTQQQAEKEEQQRIKNLVLNYDLQQNEDQESMLNPIPLSMERSFTMLIHFAVQERPSIFHHNRNDRLGRDKSQRTRKLQLSDVDW